MNRIGDENLRVRRHSRWKDAGAGVLAVALCVVLSSCASIDAHRAAVSAPPAPTLIGAPSPAPTAERGPVVPPPRPAVTADAASKAKAAAWLAGAVLPPGASRVQSPPPGTSIDDEEQSWWCEPMAKADAYWTVSGMSMVDAANWLRTHPSNGLQVVFPTLEPPHPDATNDYVNDFPSATAYEGMTFDLATWGSSATVIHLQLAVLSSNSTCATAGPGQQLMTAGG